MADLCVDPARDHVPETGIFVRAKRDGKFGSHDISSLDRESLLTWLQSGRDEIALNVVGSLLGHGNLV